MQRRGFVFRHPTLFLLRHASRPSEQEPAQKLSRECLTPDEIVFATIDPDKLSEEKKEHLSACEVCKNKIFVSE